MESVTSDANDKEQQQQQQQQGEKQPQQQPESSTKDATPSTIVWETRPSVSRKPRIILAASGSVAAIKFGILADSLSDWAEVRAVATKPSLHFIDRKGLPASVKLYTDEDEWSSWSRIGDNVLHIELRKWADAMLIAPLSANTLAKIAGGLCDNLLTCIVRAWDFSKPMFIAPAMNTFMWTSPFTLRHLTALEELGVTVISPISKRLACGDTGNGAMAEPATIDSAMRLSVLSDPNIIQSLPAPPPRAI